MVVFAISTMVVVMLACLFLFSVLKDTGEASRRGTAPGAAARARARRARANM